jgi:hypothetical protein
MEDERGIIKNRDYKRHIIDYHGLRVGKITPTDIDGFIDFYNKAAVIMEFKYKGLGISQGQNLAIERLTDNLQFSGIECIAIYATHDIDDIDEDIQASECIVLKIRYKGKWAIQNKPVTVKYCIERFLESCGL